MLVVHVVAVVDVAVEEMVGVEMVEVGVEMVEVEVEEGEMAGDLGPTQGDKGDVTESFFFASLFLF